MAALARQLGFAIPKQAAGDSHTAFEQKRHKVVLSSDTGDLNERDCGDSAEHEDQLVVGVLLGDQPASLAGGYALRAASLAPDDISDEELEAPKDLKIYDEQLEALKDSHGCEPSPELHAKALCAAVGFKFGATPDGVRNRVVPDSKELS